MLKREKKLERAIAKERIDILFKLAEDGCYDARRCIEIARKISMKYKIKLPKKYKLMFCRRCLHPYKAGLFRVRIAKSRVIITCLRCGYIRRVPIKPIKIKIKNENKKGKV